MTFPGFRKSLGSFFGLAVLCLAGCGSVALPPVPEPQAAPPANGAQLDFAAGQLAEQSQDWARAAAAYRSALQADPDSLLLWRALAEMLMQLDRAGQVLEPFQAALKKHPDNPDWIFLLGEIADAAGDTAAAEASYRRCAGLGHPTVEVFTALGLLLLDEERESEGEIFLEKALALDPHARRARLAEAEAAIDRGDYARALAVLKAALNADPGDEEWLFRLGKVYELQGKKIEALDKYKRLLAVDPENSDARHALVNIYLEQNDWGAALPWLEALRRSEPDDTLAERNLGAAYFELEQWDAARPLLNDLVERHQADAMTHFMLGSIYRGRGHWLLAEQELNEARRDPGLSPDAELELADVEIELNESGKAAALLAALRPKVDGDAHRLLRYALAALRLDDARNAAGALHSALALAPRDPALWFHLGRVFLAQKKIPEALQAWQHALRLDPKFAEAWNHLAYTCGEGGIRLTEAEGWAKRAVDLEPGNGNYRDTLGWVYFQEKKYAPALAELLRAQDCFRAHPEGMDPVIYDHLGDAYEKLNRGGDALRAWAQALKLNPKDAALQEKIKRRQPAGK